MSSLFIIVLSTACFCGFFGFLIGMLIGLRHGKSLAKYEVIRYSKRNPLDYAFELTDELYPESIEETIEIPLHQESRLGKEPEILKEHWSLN